MYVGGLKAEIQAIVWKVRSRVFAPILHSAQQLFSVHTNGDFWPELSTTLGNDFSVSRRLDQSYDH